MDAAGLTGCVSKQHKHAHIFSVRSRVNVYRTWACALGFCQHLQKQTSCTVQCQESWRAFYGFCVKLSSCTSSYIFPVIDSICSQIKSFAEEMMMMFESQGLIQRMLQRPDSQKPQSDANLFLLFWPSNPCHCFYGYRTGLFCCYLERACADL